MADIPILCFHPPTPPSPPKPALQTPSPPTPPASPPQSRPPPPSLEPDAPSDALENMDIDDDALLETPPAVPSLLSDFDAHAASIDLRLGIRDAERESDSDSTDTMFPSTPTRPSTPSVPSTPASLVAARNTWLGAQTRRASASARGEFKSPKHEQDWAAAETYVSSLEDSLMALYRCLESMELEGQQRECQGQFGVQ